MAISKDFILHWYLKPFQHVHTCTYGTRLVTLEDRIHCKNHMTNHQEYRLQLCASTHCNWWHEKQL